MTAVPRVLGLALLVVSAAAGADERLTNIDPDWLPDEATIQAWHARKAAGVHTFTGSPSWQDFMQVVEAGMEQAGVVDVVRDRFRYKRWFTSDDPVVGDWSLTINGEPIRIASYWAYSGSTPREGVTAPLIVYSRDLPREALRDRIVIFQVPALGEPLPKMFDPPEFEFATDADTLYDNHVLSSNQWYQTNYVTRIGRFDSVVRDSGAAGALVIFSMNHGRAAGLYTFPLLEPGTTGVPGLYLDREAGERVLEAAAKGHSATLRLIATEKTVEGHFYTGFLPGRHYGTARDEYVLLLTHSDGPNLTQDNGGFALLSVVQYFARLEQQDRPRTLVVMLDPQHFTPHRHRDDWYAMHPDIVRRVVATIGIEHLGQREYVERDGRFVPSGLPEPTLVFVQDNDLLIEAAVEGVQAFDMPRTAVHSPPRGGQGNWSGMSDVAVKRHFPGYGISTGMSAYWSTRAGIETFDAGLFRKQVGLGAHLTGVLLAAGRAELTLPEKD